MTLEFTAFYADRRNRVLGSLAAVCGSLDEAAEATDEAFARALSDWDRLATMENPAGWVYRVALNHVRRRASRRSRERELLAANHRPEEPTIDGPAGEAWSLVADLSPRQREVVVLRHIGDLPEADIAEILGISRGTVASTLHDAHRRLRAALSPEADRTADDLSTPAPPTEPATTAHRGAAPTTARRPDEPAPTAGTRHRSMPTNGAPERPPSPDDGALP